MNSTTTLRFAALSGALLIASASVFAGEAISLPTAQEIATAKLTDAIQRGQVQSQGDLVFVICTDSGDGSSPVVVVDAPQKLSGSGDDLISFSNKDAGSSFKGKLEDVRNRKGSKRLSGAYSLVTSHSSDGQPTPMGKMEFSANSILTEGGLTLIGGGQTSAVSSSTGQRTSTSCYVFAYYK